MVVQVRADAGELRREVLETDPRPIGELRPAIPGHLAGTIMRMLHKDRRRRCASARESLDAFERAIADLRAQGAVIVDSVAMPTVPGRRVGNDFETEEATDRYLAQHPNAPYKTLKEILLAGGVTPSRARALMTYVGRSTAEADEVAA